MPGVTEVPGVTEDHIKKFAAVPSARVSEFLKRRGWQLLPGGRSGNLWVIHGNALDDLCAVCDGEPDFNDLGPDGEAPYCWHHSPTAALVYPSPGREGAEMALRGVCAEARMTPEELLDALSLELADEAHLYFRSPLFAFPADAEEVHDAVGGLLDIVRLCYAIDGDGGETVTYGDVTVTAPDHVTVSFRHTFDYTYEPDEEDDRTRFLSRLAAERLEQTLNLLNPSRRQLSTVRQYATGELTLEQVMEPEDFRPERGPERELWDALDGFWRRHEPFVRWRFDWAWGAG